MSLTFAQLAAACFGDSIFKNPRQDTTILKVSVSKIWNTKAHRAMNTHFGIRTLFMMAYLLGRPPPRHVLCNTFEKHLVK